MASEKLVKIALAGALVAVALSVAGYVFVVVKDYLGCESAVSQAAKLGKTLSCKDARAALSAAAK